MTPAADEGAQITAYICPKDIYDEVFPVATHCLSFTVTKWTTECVEPNAITSTSPGSDHIRPGNAASTYTFDAWTTDPSQCLAGMTYAVDAGYPSIQHNIAFALSTPNLNANAGREFTFTGSTDASSANRLSWVSSGALGNDVTIRVKLVNRAGAEITAVGKYRDVTLNVRDPRCDQPTLTFSSSLSVT
jgi:hypothetical protein